MASSRLRHVIQILSDGKFHSGQSIGAKLGISRAAVWKIIDAMKNLGIDVYSVKGKGYRIPKCLELLEQEQAIEHLDDRVHSSLSGMDIFLEIDSTNSYLMQNYPRELESGHVCMAESQSAGRGRRGRDWISPFAQNIYLSLYWRFVHGPASLSGMSLALAIAVVRALRRDGVRGLSVKWPNDILLNGKKLAGILLEVTGEASGPCHAVIGVGVNVDMSHPSADTIDQPWTDLASTGYEIERNRLAGSLINELFLVIEQFQSAGIRSFLDEWAEFDAAYGRPVTIIQDKIRVAGEGRGVDEQGLFLLQTGNELRRFFSGEVSLRLQGKT